MFYRIAMTKEISIKFPSGQSTMVYGLVSEFELPTPLSR